jgi:hypothetical protein
MNKMVDFGKPTRPDGGSYMDEILLRAEQKRKRAHDILEKLQLLERWKAVGQPVVVGAARYGLMAALDIDMEIYTETPEIRAGFEVLSKVAEHPGVRQVLFMNELHGPDQGLYWQIRYCDEVGDQWKVDSWLVSHQHPDAHWCERFGEAIGNVLTDESRRTIIQIKEASLEEKAGLRGIDVYRGVLEGKATILADCLTWLRGHRAEGMCHWLPCR